MSTPLSNMPGLNSIQVKSSVSTRLNPEFFDRKNKKRDKLKLNYQKLSENTQKKEQRIRTQLYDHSVQLEVLLTRKRRTDINHAMQKDFLSDKIARLRRGFNKINRELSTQEANFQQSESEFTLDESQKLRTFLLSLRPLQEAGQIVVEERLQVQSALGNLVQRQQSLDLQLLELKAELEKTNREAASFKANKQQLESAFDHVKVSYPLEFNEIVKEIQIQRQIAHLTEKKSKQGSELNEIDRRIAEMERDRAKATSDLQKWEGQRRAGSLNSPEEVQLVQLENTLTLKCQDLGLNPLSKAVAVTAKDLGIDLLGCIKKEQYKLIEDHELKLTERAKVQNETFERKIQELTQLQEQGRLEDSLDMERTMMDLQHSVTQLRIEADYFNRKHTCCLANIHQWKIKNKRCRVIPDNLTWPSDADVLTEFKSGVASPDQFAEIEALAGRYIRMLCQRDGLTNSSALIEIKASGEIKQQKNYIKMLDSQLNSLLYERESIHKEFIKLVNIEKVATRKLKALKEESELERKRIIASRLEQILKGKISEMQKVHRGFGEAAMQRVKQIEFNKLKAESEDRKRQVQKKIEDLYSNKGYWDSQIQHLQDRVKPSALEQLQQDMIAVKSQIDSHRRQIQVISEAEDELSAKAEAMVQAKKKEISRSQSKALIRQGGAADYSKIDELYIERSNKQQALEQVQMELKTLEDAHSHAMQKLTLDESATKKKLAILQEEFKVIESNRNKALSLQGKLRALQKEMATIGMALFAGEKYEPAPVQPADQRLSNSVVMSEQESEEQEIQQAQEIVKKLKLQIEVERYSRDAMGTIMSPIALSATGLDEPAQILTNYRLNAEDLTSEEILCLKTIVPLLNGCQLYKKFSKRTSTGFSEFDPILADKRPIEQCGFGLRSFRLNKELSRIEIRKPKSLAKMELKQRKGAGVESSIPIADLRGPTIPRHTMEIVKAQKKQWLVNTSDDDPSHEEAYVDMKTSGIIVYEDPAFQSRTRFVKFYPFFICVEGLGRTEVVAEDYITFKQWVDGINALYKYKRQLGRLRYNIEIIGQ